MKISRIVNFFAGLAVGVAMMTPVQATLYNSPLHTFSINDVQGDFMGNTYGGAAGIPPDNSIICIGGGCPAPITDTKLLPNQSITLYPVDSEFGYDVIDFLGAAQKSPRDNDYAEGFVGNINAGFPASAEIDGVSVSFNPAITGGIAVSNAATDFYKVKPPMGTWCRGLGGNSVKCETEHYSVMEHILSCHEVIPYFFADPITGVQAILNDDGAIPSLGTFDCADAELDDLALIMVGGVLGPQLVDGTPCDAVNDPVGCQMFPNDKTDTQNDVALTTDYSVQLKDDGKALYGWGTIHKRPNDIRLYTSLALPAEWKQPGANYIINKAKLVVRHHITNNPNDQLRPEDLENEAAIGRKPDYKIEGTIGGTDEVWKSTKACFEGDGDLIDDEFGVIDPHFSPIGTIFKNTPFAVTNNPPLDPTDPYPFSSDLTGAFTNAWYTTIDRDPFEWSYDMDPDPTIQDYEGSWLEDDGTLTGAGGVLVSGPRWRLKPNKYGQDLPGLEITKEVGSEPGLPAPPPDADCYPPPFEKALIKYEVGLPTITEINLLDWNTATTSPLKFSSGWIDVTQNGFVTVAGTNNGVPYTTNGLPMTDDFDLAVYIKGDRKATAVYDAWLEIDYDLAPQVVVPDVVDLPQATAVADIQAAGLVVGAITTASHPTIVAGNVISTTPVAGTTVFVGSMVDLLVSTGPGVVNVVVPDVVGLPQATAVADIQAVNLVASSTTASDPVVPAGDVISQNPAAGTTVATGTTVNIVVSTGPVVTTSDVTISSVSVPSAVFQGVTRNVSVTIVNAATASGDGTGTVTVTATDGTNQVFTFTNLIPGATRTFSFPWTSPTNPTSGTVVWTFDVTVGGVIVDTATASTKIRGFSG